MPRRIFHDAVVIAGPGRRVDVRSASTCGIAIAASAPSAPQDGSMPFDDRAVRDTVARMEALLSEVRASRGSRGVTLRQVRPPEIRVAIASAGHGKACDVCEERLAPDHRHLLEPEAR